MMSEPIKKIQHDIFSKDLSVIGNPTGWGREKIKLCKRVEVGSLSLLKIPVVNI
jgi:hypothetical protein